MPTNLPGDPKYIDETLKVSDEHTKSAADTPVLKEFNALHWAEENRESIAAFNKEIEERGVWSEGMCSW